MKNIILIICLLIGQNSFGQANDKISSRFEIDETIKNKAEEKISESEFGGLFEDLFLVYDNLMMVDYFENDSLVMSTKNEERKGPFKSFFCSQNDTLAISGVYGLFGGFGFLIKVIHNKPIVHHVLLGDEFPIYSKTKNGELKFMIEVPCTKTKVILSKQPELKEGEIIYGFVEFESDEYYQSGGSVDGKEIEERKKIRMNMTVYFKSKYIDQEK